MKNSTRRSFIKMIAAAGTAAVTVGRTVLANAPAGAGAKKPVAESDATAQALGYKHDIKNVDKAKFPQRFKPEAKDQYCNNCMFYAKQDDKWGACQLIASGNVAAKGWCMSWAKKS